MKITSDTPRQLYIDWLRHKKQKAAFQEYILTELFHKKLINSASYGKFLFCRLVGGEPQFVSEPIDTDAVSRFWNSVPVLHRGKAYVNTKVDCALHYINVSLFSWSSIYADWDWDKSTSKRIVNGSWTIKINYHFHIAGIHTNDYVMISWSPDEFAAWLRNKKLESVGIV